ARSRLDDALLRVGAHDARESRAAQAGIRLRNEVLLRRRGNGREPVDAANMVEVGLVEGRELRVGRAGRLALVFALVIAERRLRALQARALASFERAKPTHVAPRVHEQLVLAVTTDAQELRIVAPVVLAALEGAESE